MEPAIGSSVALNKNVEHCNAQQVFIDVDTLLVTFALTARSDSCLQEVMGSLQQLCWMCVMHTSAKLVALCYAQQRLAANRYLILQLEMEA